MRRLVRHPVFPILSAALVIHAAVLLFSRLSNGVIDSHALQSLDAREYVAIARNLAGHGAFSLSERPPFTPDTWRTPGYPWFLAAIVLLGGDSPSALVVVQQLLSVVNVLLLFAVAGRAMSRRRAQIAALLFLFEPYHVWYSLWLLSVTLFVTVLLLTWYAWQKAIAGGPRSWIVALGMLSGFAVLVWPLGVLLPIVLFVGLGVLARRRLAPRNAPALDAGGVAAPTRGRESGEPVRSEPVRPPPLLRKNGAPGSARAARSVFGRTPVCVPDCKRTLSGRGVRTGRLALPLFAVSYFIVVGSWMGRNSLVAGHFALSDQSGVVLAYFKAAEVALWRQGRTADRYLETTLDPTKRGQPHRVWEEIDTRLQSRFSDWPKPVRDTLRWRNLAQGNKSAADSFAVSSALKRDALSFLTEAPLSTALCCLVRCGAIVTFPLNLALHPPHGVSGTRLAWLIKSLPYVVLAVGVLIRVLRGSLSFEQAYFPIACTAALLLAATPQLDPRFRTPLIPLLLVLALVRSPRGVSRSPF